VEQSKPLARVKKTVEKVSATKRWAIEDRTSQLLARVGACARLRE
jgi:hypothetical protein